MSIEYMNNEYWVMPEYSEYEYSLNQIQQCPSNAWAVLSTGPGTLKYYKIRTIIKKKNKMLPPKPFSSWKNRKKFKRQHFFSSSEEHFEEMKQCVAHKYLTTSGRYTD